MSGEGYILYRSPYTFDRSNILQFAHLLFTLSVSNGKLEKILSTNES